MSMVLFPFSSYSLAPVLGACSLQIDVSEHTLGVDTAGGLCRVIHVVLVSGPRATGVPGASLS